MSKQPDSNIKSVVLGTVNTHKFISAGEIALRTSFREKDILDALIQLTNERMILEFGGCPKRWKSKTVEKTEEDDDKL